MPSMADIIVDSSTAPGSINYKAKVASAGDKIPAVWTNDAASAITGFRPKFQVQTRDNGSNSARIMEGTFTWPVTQTVDGVTTKIAIVPIDFRAVLPTNVDHALPYEAFFQFGELMGSTLIRQVADAGYAPT